MTIRNFFRNWLGITHVENTLEKIKIPTDTQLRKYVGNAVNCAINGEGDQEFIGWGILPETKNTLIRAIEKASFEISSKQAKNEVHDIVDNEKFIDSVISRINKKQLLDR